MNDVTFLTSAINNRQFE